MKADIEIISDEGRIRPEESEVERLWASNEKAQQLLGWQPAYGGLDGFRRGRVRVVSCVEKGLGRSHQKKAPKCLF